MAPERTRFPSLPAESARSADAARCLDRVGALLAAGLPARRCWRLALAEHAAATRALDRGESIAAAVRLIEGDGWSDVAVLLATAEATGAPALPVVRALAEAARDAAESARSASIALAGPTASARVVLALPLLGLLLGSLTGADAIGVLVGSPVGWMCLALGGTLVVAARRWSRSLVQRVRPSGRSPGLLLEAHAVALSGGGSWTHAHELVDAAIGVPVDGTDASRGDAAVEAHADAAERRVLAAMVDLAADAGIPAVGLLRAAAADLRRDAAAAQRAAAERLSVHLLVPLGVCILPAFVLVGVVPVVVAVFSSTVAGP